ncbi:MAG: hypothetical protein ACREEP_00330 [Dongiaceae bacterium]
MRSVAALLLLAIISASCAPAPRHSGPDEWSLVTTTPANGPIPKIEIIHSLRPSLEACKGAGAELQATVPPDAEYRMECRLNCVKSGKHYDCERAETIKQ